MKCLQGWLWSEANHPEDYTHRGSLGLIWDGESHHHRTCYPRVQGSGGRRGHLCLWCRLYYVYMCLTMKCVLGNVFLIFTYITEECVCEREKETCQNPKENSLALHSIIYTKLSDKFAEGVGMWFCWYF